MPMARRSAPAHRKHAVDDSRSGMRSAIAQRSQIGDEPDEPEECRDGGVGGDSKDVPHERTTELRPYTHGARVRKQPVSQPRAPNVDGGENSGASHGKQSHGLGETVDGIAPRLPQQKK